MSNPLVRKRSGVSTHSAPSTNSDNLDSKDDVSTKSSASESSSTPAPPRAYRRTSSRYSSTKAARQEKEGQDKASAGKLSPPHGDEEDPNLVTWNGNDDPENPQNWTQGRKWAATIVVSLFSFISPLTSSMVGPALPQQAKDLNMTSTVLVQMSLSIFILAWAVGPFFLAPLSEVYGRVRVLQISNLFFLAWNLGCSFAQNTPEIIVFRFLAGLGGSAQISAGAGVLTDCWAPAQRGRAMSVYSLAPQVGGAIGPILGGWIAQKSSWRWIYWSTSIADALVQLVGLYYLKECHHGKLLRDRARRLRKETGNQELHTADGDKHLSKLIPPALKRPVVMITTQPIIQVLALYMAYLFGMFYLLFASFAGVYQDVYNESVGIASLHYIALGLGFVIGGIFNAYAVDKMFVYLKTKNGNEGRPEYNIPLMIPASFLVPIGLLWFAWSVEGRVFWIMPDIGIFIFGFAAMVSVQCCQTYIIQAYQRYAASGMAASVVLRSCAGFGFPLFAPYLFSGLGYGWGVTVLAAVSVVVGIPGPLVFWFYGSKLRAKSQFAAG